MVACSLAGQDTKIDKTKVKPAASSATQDTSSRPAAIQVTPPPPPPAGGRPPRPVQPQLDDLEKRVLALEALVDKQKALVATLGSMVSALQQDNAALKATAKEYQTHRHRLNNDLGFTQDGTMKHVITTGVEALKRPTTGPVQDN
jgi:type IV secretory pathway VirB10-like protein